MKLNQKAMGSGGFTLIEMVVAVMVTVSIIMGVVFLATYFSRSFDFSLEENIAIGDAERAVTIMTKELREARIGEDGSYPLAVADDQEVVFYGDVDNDGKVERVRYYLLDTQLIRQVFNSTGNPPVYPCVGGCTICHKPGPSETTNTIPESSWPAHQAHGDYIGACGQGGGGGGETESDTESVVVDHVRNTSNPLLYYYNGDWPGDEVNNPLAPGSRLLNTQMIGVGIQINVDPTNNVNDFELSTLVQLRNLKTNL